MTRTIPMMKTMLLLALGLLSPTAMAASAGEEAMARLQAYGPHLARYTKAGSSGVALEIHYRSPQDIALFATSPDNKVSVSIDAQDIRMRIGEDCARVSVAPLMSAASQAGQGGAAGGAITPRVDYRLTPEGQASVNVYFLQAAGSVPLLWLADLSAPDTRLTTDAAAWRAEQHGVRWIVSRETGILQQMMVGDNMLELDGVEPLPPHAPGAAGVCKASTDAELAAQLEAQFLLQAYRGVLPGLLRAWPTMSASARSDAAKRQEAVWRRYFGIEMPQWSKAMAAGDWKKQVVTGMSDPTAFRDFAEQLPAQEQNAALRRWQEAWYGSVGSELVTAHVQELEQIFLALLAADGIQVQDQAVLEGLIQQPMRNSAITTAEQVLREPLSAVITEGSSALVQKLER